MKPLLALLGLGGVAVLASSCGLLSGSSATPAQPVIVTNNIPSGSDSGTTVLLAVAGIAAFLLLAVSIVAVTAWANEKRRRTAG